MLARLQTTIEEYDFMNNENLDLIELCNIITTQPISLIGPTELQPALTRFKNQLNENSARFARVGVIPEMNHNESVAWGGVGNDRDPSVEDNVVLFLTWDGMHSRVKRRLEWMIAHTPSDLAWKINGEGITYWKVYFIFVLSWTGFQFVLLYCTVKILQRLTRFVH